MTLNKFEISERVCYTINIKRVLGMDATVWVNKEKFLSEYHRELRSWKNLINEGIKCNVPTEELVRDDERHHGRALGFLVALNCLPLSVISDNEI